jgi:1,2-phenylacetyl-CoA epoxidase PaaB subunit
VTAVAEPWEVFARQDRQIPIRHVGRVDASNLDDAMVFAVTLYEEFKWTDMFIVPRREIEQLVKPS